MRGDVESVLTVESCIPRGCTLAQISEVREPPHGPFPDDDGAEAVDAEPSMPAAL